MSKGVVRTALVVSALSVSATSSPAPAAEVISLTDLSGAEYETAGVYVRGDLTFTGTIDNGMGLDSVDLQFWDDFVLKYSQTFSLAVGSTNTFNFEASWAGSVGTSVPGIGIYLFDEGQDKVVLDPYFLPRYADPGECRVDCGPVTGAVPEPATWAIMLLGFGLVGGAMRRRKQMVSVSYA